MRNHLYDIGHKKSFEFDTLVISVGNLNVGGSGKTPMIEYLIRLLANNYKVVTLSRGYGRKTHGIRIAGEADTALTIGDEPFQLLRKFGDLIKVAVGEERALAIPTILHEHPETQIILLDDAFQHRRVKPQFSILVTDFEKPFCNDFLLPFGRLREARTGACRADAVVVTKADYASTTEQITLEKKIKQITTTKPIFFTGLSFHDPISIHGKLPIGKRILLLSGIAKNTQFAKAISNRFEIVKHIRFEDHHVYTVADINRINDAANMLQVDAILTTEKDMVKLIMKPLLPLIEDKNWFYLPVRTIFLKDGMQFDEMLLRMVKSKLQNSPTNQNTVTLN
jgi:tetraacyldisaccharide 4'-kinase